jgi:hypothetical protein
VLLLVVVAAAADTGAEFAEAQGMSYAAAVRGLGAAGDAKSLARFVEHGDLGFVVSVCCIRTRWMRNSLAN